LKNGGTCSRLSVPGRGKEGASGGGKIKSSDVAFTSGGDRQTRKTRIVNEFDKTSFARKKKTKPFLVRY